MDQSSSGVAKSVDDLVTSRSIEGHDFPDVEMLIAKMASASKRIFSNQYFRRKNRAACSKNTTDLSEEGGLLRATGACDAALDLSDLFRFSSQGDIQDFDTRWDEDL